MLHPENSLQPMLKSYPCSHYNILFINFVIRQKRYIPPTMYLTPKTQLSISAHKQHAFIRNMKMVMYKQQRYPWRTMESSQLAARTMNWSHLVASCAKAFPARLTNSNLTPPRAAHPEGDVTGCHQCFHLALGKCSGISRCVTNNY